MAQTGVRASAVWTILIVGAALCFASAVTCIFLLEYHHSNADDDATLSVPMPTRLSSPLAAASSSGVVRQMVQRQDELKAQVRAAKLRHEAKGKEGQERPQKPEHPKTRRTTREEGRNTTKITNMTKHKETRQQLPHLHFPYFVYGRFSEESGTTVPPSLLSGNNDYQSAAERKAIINSIYYNATTRSLVNSALNSSITSNNSSSSLLYLQSSVGGMSTSSSRKLFEDHSDVLLPKAQTWALHAPLLHGTRNHDCVTLFDDEVSKERGDHVQIVNLLGRYSRHVEAIDMISGRYTSKTTEGRDPSGALLADLNHVSAVLVDAIYSNGTTVPSSAGLGRPKQEVWLPCGFHGDAVNSETSSEFVRIVDMDTMTIRVGPKLPSAGGACTSLAIHVLPNEPPMICSFAGTRGKHDSGEFLPQTQCYDRLRKRWWSPFGEMPFGLDHGNAAIIPSGTCKENDPARIIIMNFRTEPYGDIHPEVLAHDLPDDRWTLDALETMDGEPNRKGKWYVYHNITDPFARLEDVPRDAAGIVVADGGRHILNFGGQAHDISKAEERRATGRKRHKIKFNMIRSLDVCQKEWTKVGDMGLSTFALQSCASQRLQVAFTCGGEAPLHNSNSDMCVVSHWASMHIENQHVIG